MASQNTPNQKFRCELRKRMENTDAEAFTNLAFDLDEQLNWGAICDQPVTLDGWNVLFSSGTAFDVSVGQGLAEGELIKTVSTQAVPLDDNTDPVNPRVDLIEVGKGDVADTASTPATEVVLGPLIRTSVSGDALGTGDGATKTFSLPTSASAGGRADLFGMIIYQDAVKVSGWSLDWAANNIIFHEAPAGGVVITADYPYEVGGEESPNTYNTRYDRNVTFNVVKGTPGAGAPAGTSGAIKVCAITVPASWSGTASGVTIDNTVKEFMVHADNLVDSHSPGDSPRNGRIYSAIRNMSQVVHGCRLQYVDTDQIQVTPGWGVVGGVSWRITAPVSLTVSAGGAGWLYVYGVVADTGTKIPGSVITIVTSSTQPDSLMRDSSATRGYFYIGAIYIVSVGPVVIRPFYTHGDRVFWQAPTALVALTHASGYTPSTQTDVDAAAWVPATGRMAQVYMDIAGDMSSVGNKIEALLKSHLTATTLGIWPQVKAELHVPTTGATYRSYAQGWIRCENDSGARKFNYTFAIDPATTWSADVYVQGYVDDYRTIDEAGAVSDY